MVVALLNTTAPSRGNLRGRRIHKKTIISTPNAGLQDRSDTVEQGKSLTPVGKIDILTDFGGDTAASCVINVHFGVKSAGALFNLPKQLFLRGRKCFSTDITVSCANEFVLDLQ